MLYIGQIRYVFVAENRIINVPWGLIYGSLAVDAAGLQLPRARRNHSTIPAHRWEHGWCFKPLPAGWICWWIHTQLFSSAEHFPTSISLPSTFSGPESIRWIPIPFHGRIPTPTVTYKAPQFLIPTTPKLSPYAKRGYGFERITSRVQLAFAVDLVDVRPGEVSEFEDPEDEAAFGVYGRAVVEV